ncbi:MAG: response regulator transcription factor [Chloroflexi bacterium]|nr:response regulator transcription factor [Chloroflexota bacterium]
MTELIARQSPDLVMVEVGGRFPDSATWELIHGIKRERSLPVIALVAGEVSEEINGYFEVDDFLVRPYDLSELLIRAKRLLQNCKAVSGSELIKCDGLVIDVTNCDVTVGGKVVELTFKEYELLKLLAANRGRVYTRQDLLNKIWGYDYYGGDRTVDVHVRRLRSKIEGPGEVFIETVRNVGYRFKKDA